MKTPFPTSLCAQGDTPYPRLCVLCSPVALFHGSPAPISRTFSDNNRTDSDKNRTFLDIFRTLSDILRHFLTWFWPGSGDEPRSFGLTDDRKNGPATVVDAERNLLSAMNLWLEFPNQRTEIPWLRIVNPTPLSDALVSEIPGGGTNDRLARSR